MVKRALRSRSLRRKQVRTPSGKVVQRYERRKAGIARCKCGRPLAGVIRGTTREIKKASKTRKRPNRPFANLCPKCAREEILARVHKTLKPT